MLTAVDRDSKRYGKCQPARTETCLVQRKCLGTVQRHCIGPHDSGHAAAMVAEKLRISGPPSVRAVRQAVSWISATATLQEEADLMISASLHLCMLQAAAAIAFREKTGNALPTGQPEHPPSWRGTKQPHHTITFHKNTSGA